MQLSIITATPGVCSNPPGKVEFLAVLAHEGAADGCICMAEGYGLEAGTILATGYNAHMVCANYGGFYYGYRATGQPWCWPTGPIRSGPFNSVRRTAR